MSYLMRTIIKIFSVFIFILAFNVGCSATVGENDVTQKKLYFAQPLAAYNSEAVKHLLPIIEKQFPGWHIENPNQPHHQKGHDNWKKETGKGMDYYFKVVLPKMSGGIILPFPDGAWSAGAYGEARRLEELGLPIWKITPDGTITKTTTEQMYLWDGGILSVSQTAARNKIPYDVLIKNHTDAR